MNKQLENMTNKLMPTCKEATFLISVKSFRRLRISEVISLRLHLLVCVYCRRFNRQNKIIDQGIKDILQPEHEHLHRLSKEKKEKLQREVGQLLARNNSR